MHEVTGVKIVESGSNKNIVFDIQELAGSGLPVPGDIYAITYQPVFFF
jgi:hypothetical protein